MYSFSHNTVSVIALLQCRTQRHVCFSQRRYCLIYGPDREYLQVYASQFISLPCFFSQTCVASNNTNTVMVIQKYYWCESQKEMKRSVLITVTPQFPHDDAEMNPGIKGSTSRTGPSCDISDTRALHPRVTARNQTQRPLYMLHDEEDLPSAHSQRPVGHTNGRAI